MRSRVAAVAALVGAVSAAGCGASTTALPSGTPGTSPALASSPSATPTPRDATGTRPGPSWRPTPGQLFQIQLSGKLDLSVDAQIYEFDGLETPASVLEELRPKWGGDHHFFCYVDAGSWESYRPDADAFPAAVLGKTMEGWPDERWLDIRQIDALAPILRARLDTCAARGFDGVDPDNVDGYQNDTGFPLTGADQLRFNRWLAAEAHARGLLVMLKNDGDQAAELVGDFDGAVVEQCVEYRECELYSPFVDAGKAVLDIEYNVPQKDFCAASAMYGIDVIGKRLSLDAYRLGCPG